jgi:hypothetical protein
VKGVATCARAKKIREIEVGKRGGSDCDIVVLRFDFLFVARQGLGTYGIV